MNNTEKNLYASLMVNSLNDAAARAVYCDIPFDMFMESCRGCYDLQKEISLESLSLPFAGKEKVEPTEVKLLQESPDPAPGQIWKGVESEKTYYLVLKQCDTTSLYNSNNKGWEVKVSDDLNSKFRWLCDENWTTKPPTVTFIGYKYDPTLEKNPEIERLIK